MQSKRETGLAYDPHISKAKGALAHLARAFDWQSRGDEFESRMLHVRNNINIRNAIWLQISLLEDRFVAFFMPCIQLFLDLLDFIKS